MFVRIVLALFGLIGVGLYAVSGHGTKLISEIKHPELGYKNGVRHQVAAKWGNVVSLGCHPVIAWRFAAQILGGGPWEMRPWTLFLNREA